MVDGIFFNKPSSSSWVMMVPVGLLGLAINISFVLSVTKGNKLFGTQRKSLSGANTHLRL